jgi:hypothetical protein
MDMFARGVHIAGGLRCIYVLWKRYPILNSDAGMSFYAVACLGHLYVSSRETALEGE